MSKRTASYRDTAREAQRQAIAQGGLTIKLMTLGLLSITAAHSYWMWHRRHCQSARTAQAAAHPPMAGPPAHGRPEPLRPARTVARLGAGESLRLAPLLSAFRPECAASSRLLCPPRSQRKFPWQNGVQISDLKVLLPGAKIREAEEQLRAREAALKAVAAHKAAAAAAASAAASPGAAAEAAR